MSQHMSKWQGGYRQPKDWEIEKHRREKISQTLKKHVRPPGHIQKVKDVLIERNRSIEHRIKLSAYWKGKAKTSGQRSKISGTLTGRRNKPCPLGTRNKISMALKGRLIRGENFRVGRGMLGKRHSPATREKIRLAAKRNWENPEFAEKAIKRFFKGLRSRPNHLETRIGKILDSIFPGDWKYVGGGQLVVGGKIPDFVNINGHKAVIEVFGRYWHESGDEQVRSLHFAMYGFKTLILWEDESQEVMIQKIRRFVLDLEGDVGLGDPRGRASV